MIGHPLQTALALTVAVAQARRPPGCDASGHPLTHPVTPPAPMRPTPSHQDPETVDFVTFQAQTALAHSVHLSAHHTPEPDMTAPRLIAHTARQVRELRAQGQRAQAKALAFQARREIGAKLLLGSVS